MTVNEKEITLYYPDGKIIPSMKEFLDFYNNQYFSKNKKEVEKVIEDILKNGIHSPIELFKVLAWEFTYIDMEKSTRDAFVYKGKTSEESMQIQIPRTKDIINKTDIERIYKTIENYNDKCDSDEDAQSFLNEIKAITSGKRFSSVYMITLLYFVSKGKYPIVNSSSYMALEAIYTHMNYGQKKSYPGLASRDTDAFKEIITKGKYAKYIDRMKDFSKLSGKTDLREIDQALWTYGKLFKS